MDLTSVQGPSVGGPIRILCFNHLRAAERVKLLAVSRAEDLNFIISLERLPYRLAQRQDRRCRRLLDEYITWAATVRDQTLLDHLPHQPP